MSAKNCSLLNLLFSNVQIMLIVQGVPPLGGVNQWCGGENKLFCSVDISKTVGDTSKVTIYD